MTMRRSGSIPSRLNPDTLCAPKEARPYEGVRVQFSLTDTVRLATASIVSHASRRLSLATNLDPMTPADIARMALDMNIDLLRQENLTLIASANRNFEEEESAAKKRDLARKRAYSAPAPKFRNWMQEPRPATST